MENVSNFGQIYNCTLCNYECSKKSHWKQHIISHKHQKLCNETCKNVKKPFICSCGKNYKFKSGLYRHQKNCIIMKGNNNIYSEDDITTHVDNSGKKQVTMSFEQYENLIGGIKQLIPLVEKGLEKEANKITNINNNNNNNNNRISINVFLNTRCKNAMNLTDFVEKLKVNIEDLMYTKENGYAKGISNIFVKQLQDMKPTERPIHCSDDKRMKFYVKDDNKWNKDTADTKINNAVLDVDRKQWRTIKKWETSHPGYEHSDQLYKEYMALVQATMGGGNTKAVAGNKKQIKKELGSSVKISDDLLNYC